MTQHRDFAYGEALPPSFTDALQEMLGTFMSPNARVVVLNPTTVQVPAGTDNDQVGVTINGKMRYNSANVSATHPGGAAGSYNLWATASANVFVPGGGEETDSTVYAFGLVILPVASTPVTVHSRIIGTVVWGGTAITDAYLISGRPTDGPAGTPSLRTLGTGPQQAAAGDAIAAEAAARTAAITAGIAAIPADGAVGVPSLRTIGTGALQAAAGTAPAAAQAAAIAAAVAADALLPAPLVTNVQTVSYTLVLGDVNKVIEMNAAGAVNLTVPPNSSVAFPIGAVIPIHQYGAGQVTVVPDAGVTIRAPGGKTKLNTQYSSASLRKRATDEWVLTGDLTT